MSSIDERVVEMKFDNAQFEDGVKTTQASLGGLKKSLDMSQAAGSLSNLQSVGDRFSLAGIGNGVESIAGKFTALGVAGVTALATITNQAVNTAEQLVRSVTIDPVSQGYADYERKLTSVQTIMSATGKTIGGVTKYFNQLDTYADKTIYNLSDMTSAAAKFTNAGVGLSKATPAIKGIANMVALAGQGSDAASIAFYNLSQSIAGGFLTTTDYKSLNLANVATKQWKDQMIQGAIAAGTLKKAQGGMYSVKGSKKAYTEAALFNEALHEGWANTNVLLKVLGDYGDTNTKIGKKAQAAAQDVKDFGMMMQTLQAQVGTGWTDTFDIIVGNVEESKKLFTPLTNTLGGLLDQMSEGRNRILKEWKKLGGRDLLIDSFVNGFHLLMDVLRPVKDAFTDIFPPMTGKNLYAITKAVHDFTESLFVNGTAINDIRHTFAGVFAVLDIGRMVLVEVVKMFFNLFGVAGDGAGDFLSITGSIGLFLVSVRDAIRDGNGLAKVFQVIGSVISVPIALIQALVGTIAEFIQGAGGFDGGTFTDGVDKITASITPFQVAVQFLDLLWRKMGVAIGRVATFFTPLADGIRSVVVTMSQGIYDAVKSTDYNAILDIVNTGLFGGLIALLTKFVNGGVKVVIGDASPFGKLGAIFNQVTSSLQAMETKLKAEALFKIAAAVGLLAASVFVLSTIDSGKLAVAMSAITGMFVQLSGAMFVFEKISAGPGIAKMPILAGSILALAGAIVVLSIAVKILSTMDWNEIARGITGLTAILGVLVGFMKLVNPQVPGMFKTALAIQALAIAILLLSASVAILGNMDWSTLAKGLGSIAVLLATLAGFSKIVDAKKLAEIGGAMTLIGAGMVLMATAVQILGSMDPVAVGQGLLALAIALATISGAMKLLGDGIAAKAAGLLIVGVAINAIASALLIMGQLNIAQMGIALLGLVVALGAIVGALTLMGDPIILIGAAGLIVASQALLSLAAALVVMGQLNIAQMGIALLGLVVSLAALAVALTVMGNPATLLGAAALAVAAAGIALLAPALVLMAQIDLVQLAVAMLGIMASIAIFATAASLLTPVIPSMLALAGALALLGIGVALIGGGILALSAGLVGLSISGAAGAAALVGVITTVLGLAPVIVRAAADILLGILNLINDALPKIINIVITLIMGIIKAIGQYIPAIIDMGTKILSAFMDSLVVLIPKVVTTGIKIITAVLRGIGDNIGKLADAATKVVTEFLSALGRNLPKIVDAGAKMIIKFLNGVAKAIDDNAEEMGHAGVRIAEAIIRGMVVGIGAGLSDVIGAVTNIGGVALDAIRNILGIHSPSKKFEEIGEFINEGLVKGLTGSADDVAAAFKSMSDLLSDAITQSAQDIEDYKDKIDDLTDKRKDDTAAINKQQAALNKATAVRKSGQDVIDEKNKLNDLMKARAKNTREMKDAKGDISSAKTAKARKSAQDRLTDLTTAQEKNTRKIKEQQKVIDQARKDRKSGDVVKEEQRKLDRLKRTRDKDNKAFQDAQDGLKAANDENPKYIAAQKELDAQYQAQQKTLSDLGDEHDALTETIKNQEKALDDATKQRDDYNKSIRDQYSALQEINKDTTTADYFEKLEDQVTKVNEFEQKIMDLRNRGLNDTGYQKLIASGTDALPFIDQLLNSGQDGIADFNSLTGQLKTATEKLGTEASTSMYQAGVDIAQGALNGSNSRKTQIEQQMEDIADAMVEAFKKKLGIKSPSRVFRRLGEYTTEGMAVGLTSSADTVEAAAKSVGDSAISGLQDTMSNLGSTISMNLDASPTIRPVLDLSGVKKDAGLVNGMINGQSIALDTSYNAANAAANGYNANQEAMLAVKDQVATDTGSMTFNQYNSSPRALNDAEIYRQTNNQLSRVKGER